MFVFTHTSAGTGTGLVSVVLATLLSHCPDNPRSTIIATDLRKYRLPAHLDIPFEPRNNEFIVPGGRLRSTRYGDLRDELIR